MTVAIEGPRPTLADRVERQPVLLSRPGVIEHAMVVLTTFILVHQTPNVWFRTRSEFLDDSSNPLMIVIILALIAIAFARVAGCIDHLISMLRLETALYLFAGMTFATIFWSADPAETLKRSILFISVTLFASYLVMRFSLDQIIRLLALMWTISAVLNLGFVLAFPEYGVTGDSWSGIFPQKNALGYTAALGVPTLVIAARARRQLRFVFYPAAAIQVVLLVGSQSKTMLLATLGPTCLMVVYNAFRGRRTLRGAVLFSLIGSSVFTVAFATANIAVLARWLDKDVTLTGRVPLWENLLPVAGERPLTGHGYGATFGGFHSPIHEIWIQNRWNPSHAHNALLQIWLEMGLVAVALFLFLYVRAVSRGIKVVAIVPGAVGLWPLVFLTTTLLVSITESGMTANLLGWLMLTVAVLSVSLHLKHRDRLGLSNDLRDVVGARRPPTASGTEVDDLL
ncbi:MAG: O-antigen ligase family protein [Acidimicrobiales bacterium]